MASVSFFRLEKLIKTCEAKFSKIHMSMVCAYLTCKEEGEVGERIKVQYGGGGGGGGVRNVGKGEGLGGKRLGREKVREGEG